MSNLDTVAVAGANFTGNMSTLEVATRFPDTEVIQIEQDDIPSEPANTPSVSQGFQVHVIRANTWNYWFGKYPTLREAMAKAGVPKCRRPSDVLLFHKGGVVNRFAPDSGITTYQPSQRWLSAYFRGLVAQCPNVRTIKGTVTDLMWNADKSHVEGMIYRTPDGDEHELSADISALAMGRNSMMEIRKWMTKAGYVVPARETIDAGVQYTSVEYDSVDLPPGVTLAAVTDNEESQCAAVILKMENRRWLATVITIGRQAVPHTHDEFLVYMKSCHPELHRAIAYAKPLTKVVTFKNCKNARIRWSAVTNFPRGVAILGDAVSYTGPRYGTGVTDAWKSAECFGRFLEHRNPRIFWLEMDAFMNQSWLVAESAEKRYWPELEINGKQASRRDVLPALLIRESYANEIEDGIVEDPRIYEDINLISNGFVGPAHLFNPELRKHRTKVFVRNWKRRLHLGK